MSYQITCPYCFETMMDDEVLFRSERVSLKDESPLPDDYNDLEDFKARYKGADKAALLEKIEEWEFFLPREDPVYQSFWHPFGGTTEHDEADFARKIPSAWRRRILDPENPQHQRYLKKQPRRAGSPEEQEGNPYFIRDEKGNAEQLQLKWDNAFFRGRCERRACRYCHNPLPVDYGKNPVKFATVIGITGAGKTVYLSQLLREIRKYAKRVKLDAKPSGSANDFLEQNPVAAGKPLPASTSSDRLQQPLFFELASNGLGMSKENKTFVLYDVAGEIFSGSPQRVQQVAPYIEHADGLIVLIDPLQFESISSLTPDGETRAEPTKALETIHKIICRESDRLCSTPVAICVSKADNPSVQRVLPDELRRLLLEDVHSVLDSQNSPLRLFNAGEYNPIAQLLNGFFEANAEELANSMKTNYSNYDYFAFTSLGCDVTQQEWENGERYSTPVGPVLPKRIEEPLLWLFYQLGYIGLPQGQEIFSPAVKVVYCPECGSDQTYELPEEERWATVRKLFRTKMLYQDRCCTACGCRWDSSGKGGAQ